MTLLQAAMGAGFVLQCLIKIFIFVGIPFVTILLSLTRGKGKRSLAKQSMKEALGTILANLLYAILIIVTIAVALLFFLYFAVDLTDS
jgi:hypothetical protein